MVQQKKLKEKKTEEKQTFFPVRLIREKKKVKTSSPAQGYSEVQHFEDHSACL